MPIEKTVRAIDGVHLKMLVLQHIQEHGLGCDLNHIDTSGVTDMAELFESSQFVGDISQWDVSNVTSMRDMFRNAAFNGDISGWDTARLTNMSGMFEASVFNGDISRWDVSNVHTMQHVFYKSSFSGDISKWDVSNVTTMQGLFTESQFNGDISQWNVGRVQTFAWLFRSSVFTGDISRWNTSSAKSMSGMFAHSLFHGDISRWDVSNVKNMSNMFASSAFNGDISQWNTGRATTMQSMFENSVFDGNISQWNVENVSSMEAMFRHSKFNQDISAWKPHRVGQYMGQQLAAWFDLSEVRQRSEKQFAQTGQSIYIDGIDAQGNMVVAPLNERVWLNFHHHQSMTARNHGSTTGCQDMFSGAAFSHDVSMWPLPLECNTEGMFRNTVAWAAQKPSTWIALHCAKHDESPKDLSTQVWLQGLPRGLPLHDTIALYQEYTNAIAAPATPTRPATPMELYREVRKEIDLRGPHCSLNHIDVSGLTSLAGIFANTPFVGDISQWNVSNALALDRMFENCPFNGDISGWQTKNVHSMQGMFKGSAFNGDISQWDTSQVRDMSEMFRDSVFDQEIGNWNVKKVFTMHKMFENSQFNRDIGQWTIGRLGYTWGPALQLMADTDLADALDPLQKERNRKHASDMMGKSFLGKLVTQKMKEKWAKNPEYFSAQDMFKNAAFAKDISGWTIPAETSTLNMFAQNLAGLNAQTQMAPWVVKECIAQRFIPHEPQWKHIFTTCLGIVESLHDSVDDRYIAMQDLHAKLNHPEPEESYSLDAMF